MWLPIVFFCLIQLILIGFALRILFTMLFMIIYHKRELPFVPTTRAVIRMIARSGYIHDGDRIVDLGCGTGSIIIALVRRFPRARYLGVDNAPLLATVARLRTLPWHRRVEIVCDDMFVQDISQAQVIVGFWVTELMPRIIDKITTECASGTVVMSHMFPLPAHTRLQREKILTHKTHIVHVYRVL